jgi:hypothetical protein
MLGTKAPPAPPHPGGYGRDSEDSLSTVDGTWNTVIATPMGQQSAVLDLVTDGGALTGTATQNGVPTELVDGQVDGNNITFTAAVTMPFPLELGFALTVDGDAISGTVTAGPFPPSQLTGTRA